MAASETLREALNVLFERGWYKGAYEGDDGSVCMMRALGIAQGTPFAAIWMSPECDYLHDAVRSYRTVFTDIPAFNDSDETTFDDIVEVFDRAEKIAEAREAD